MTTESLELRLKAFRLPSFLAHYEPLAERGQKEGWPYIQYLEELSVLEAQERQDRKITRLLKQSRLPRDKTLSTLELGRLPTTVRGQIKHLCDGDFLEGAINVCIFGNPGAGKSHAMAAIAHELVMQGRSVLFTPVSALVERLLQAKRDLRLTKELKKLDRIEVVPGIWTVG